MGNLKGENGNNGRPFFAADCVRIVVK